MISDGSTQFIVRVISSQAYVDNIHTLAQKYADTIVNNLINSGAIPYVPYPYKRDNILTIEDIKDTVWRDDVNIYKIIAPYNGYYSMYMRGIVNDASGQTRAGYLSIDGNECARNAEYGGGRDFSCGYVYAPKGATINYATVYVKDVYIHCMHSAKD